MSARAIRTRSTPERPIRGRANLEFLRSMTEEEIERAVPAEYRNLPDAFWDDAVVVWPIEKQPVSIRVDRDVLEWFRGTGPRYQTRMNAVLRSYMTRMRGGDDRNPAPSRPPRRKRRAV